MPIELGGTWRRGRETHRQRLHRPGDVAARLRRLGLSVRIRRGYETASTQSRAFGTAGHKRFAPGHFVVIANQPGRDRV